MRVLGLSGSLRSGSHNTMLLRAAAELLPPQAELVVFDGLKAIPPYDEDDEHDRPLAESPLRNKPVAVVGASTGLFGAVWAQAEARKVLSAIAARVIDRELPIGMADDAFGADGALVDDDQSLALAGILAELAGEARPVALAA